MNFRFHIHIADCALLNMHVQLTILDWLVIFFCTISSTNDTLNQLINAYKPGEMSTPLKESLAALTSDKIEWVFMAALQVRNESNRKQTTIRSEILTTETCLKVLKFDLEHMENLAKDEMGKFRPELRKINADFIRYAVQSLYIDDPRTHLTHLHSNFRNELIMLFLVFLKFLHSKNVNIILFAQFCPSTQGHIRKENPSVIRQCGNRNEFVNRYSKSSCHIWRFFCE